MRAILKEIRDEIRLLRVTLASTARLTSMSGAETGADGGACDKELNVSMVPTTNPNEIGTESSSIERMVLERLSSLRRKPMRTKPRTPRAMLRKHGR
jgi:hypothetical protein